MGRRNCGSSLQTIRNDQTPTPRFGNPITLLSTQRNDSERMLYSKCLLSPPSRFSSQLFAKPCDRVRLCRVSPPVRAEHDVGAGQESVVGVTQRKAQVVDATQIDLG
mmetsp:Transcript_71404/g.168287  ORF Transcript_71404/g.168287 Transcript_71404/m.168287 type:complete len:107 (-) Transcript_71404:1266-1586(-)